MMAFGFIRLRTFWGFRGLVSIPGFRDRVRGRPLDFSRCQIDFPLSSLQTFWVVVLFNRV